jgi:hypothetical protein
MGKNEKDVRGKREGCLTAGQPRGLGSIKDRSSERTQNFYQKSSPPIKHVMDEK